MNDFHERLTIELRELKLKIHNLNVFMNSEGFKAIQLEQQRLLKRQYLVMLAYAEILEERLSLLEEVK